MFNARSLIIVSVTSICSLTFNPLTTLDAEAATTVQQPAGQFHDLLQRGVALVGQGRGFPDEKGLNNYGHALLLFDQAYTSAGTDLERGEALGRRGEVLALQKKYPEALSYLTKARKLRGSARLAWMDELALDIERTMAAKPLTEKVILRGLVRQKPDQNRLDSAQQSVQDQPLHLASADTFIKPEPADRTKPVQAPVTQSSRLDNNAPQNNASALNDVINIRLNFVTNSTALDRSTQQNLEVLANALSDGSLRNKKFRFVGHTDVRGDASYNLNLSIGRAKAVYQSIAALRPALANRIATLGRGESEPLYQGQTAEIHRFNRRLEVVVLDDHR